VLRDRALLEDEASALAAQAVSAGHGPPRRASQSCLSGRWIPVSARRIATTEDRISVRSHAQARSALPGSGRSRTRAGSERPGSARAVTRTCPDEDVSARTVPRIDPNKGASAPTAVSTRSAEVDSPSVTTTSRPNPGVSSRSPPANPLSHLLHALREIAVRVVIHTLLSPPVRGHRGRAIPHLATDRDRAVVEHLPERIARNRAAATWIASLHVRAAASPVRTPHAPRAHLSRSQQHSTSGQRSPGSAPVIRIRVPRAYRVRTKRTVPRAPSDSIRT